MIERQIAINSRINFDIENPLFEQRDGTHVTCHIIPLRDYVTRETPSSSRFACAWVELSRLGVLYTCHVQLLYLDVAQRVTRLLLEL